MNFRNKRKLDAKDRGGKVQKICKLECGPEAACHIFQNHTIVCICPHDFSLPTSDLKCQRHTVPFGLGRPILNVIPTLNNETNPNPPINLNSSVGYHPSIPTASQTGHILFGIPINGGSIVISTCILACLSIVAMIIWKFCCHGLEKRSRKATVINLHKTMIPGNRYLMNDTYLSSEKYTEIMKLVPSINRNSITNMEEIGAGFFGKVFKGKMSGYDENEVQTVAIKMLKDTTTTDVSEEDFIREIEIMSSFKHPKILTLIGVCPKDKTNSPWMIFEYMVFGDLAEVLRHNGKTFCRNMQALPTLCSKSLLSIAVQIAEGMEYLASQRFVHRDLACRNCLVGENLTVKIGDFGMSRDVYTCDYYRIGGSRMLPIRWMSPESVLYGRFTLASDVWSYGVVLWEIYSYGKQPYFGSTNEEVMAFVLNNQLLEIPSNCPMEVQRIMMCCWKLNTKERYNFTKICQVLHKLLISGGWGKKGREDKCTNNIKDNISVLEEISTLPKPPLQPITINSSIEMDDKYYLNPSVCPYDFDCAETLV